MKNNNILSSFINNKLKFFFDNLLRQLSYGSINVQYPNGENILYCGTNKGPEANIRLFNYKLVKDIIIKGNIGFGESYINKNFTTSNLSDLIEVAVLNKNSFKKFEKGNIFYSFIQQIFHYRNHNSKTNSVDNITHHYDLGNDFYKYWLDETMSYSSALYDERSLELKDAQVNKYQRLLSLIKPSNKSKILEIGCGWGGLASYLVKKTNAHVTTLTISKKQYEHVSKMIYEEGLQENIKVELKDYRDVNTKFDSIVSVEMFEAVGEKYWPIFFNKLKTNLNNGGNAALQVITISDELFSDYKKKPDFIQRHIFPGGMLPSKKIFRNLVLSENLKLEDEYSFGTSYAKTLKEWNKRFQYYWPEIAKNGFNDFFKRKWEYYLSYCEGGFKGKSIDISQFLITK